MSYYPYLIKKIAPMKKIAIVVCRKKIDFHVCAEASHGCMLSDTGTTGSTASSSGSRREI
jgi:hypothetical protein